MNRFITLSSPESKQHVSVRLDRIKSLYFSEDLVDGKVMIYIGHYGQEQDEKMAMPLEKAKTLLRAFEAYNSDPGETVSRFQEETVGHLFEER